MALSEQVSKTAEFAKTEKRLLIFNLTISAGIRPWNLQVSRH